MNGTIMNQNTKLNKYSPKTALHYPAPGRVICLALISVLLGCVALASGDEAASASPDSNTQIARQINQVFRRAVQRVQPAVVFMHVTKKNASGESNDASAGEDDTPVYEGVGSGCIIDPLGYVITNYHVVENYDKVEVLLADGRHFSAAEILGDPDTDLAVVRIDCQDQKLPAAVFGDSDEAQVGDFVMAIGSPFGLKQTVTSGIISFKGRQTNILGDWGYEDFIQTDADINKGNSGGPLINLQGEIIGINSNIFTISGFSLGYGFAVPSNLAQFVSDQLINNKQVKRGYLGVSLNRLNLEELRKIPAGELTRLEGISPLLGKLPQDINGIIISQVHPGSPAESAGMKDKDVVLQIDDKIITSSKQLRDIIARLGPQAQPQFVLWRDDKKITLQATLGDRKEAQEKYALRSADSLTPFDTPEGFAPQEEPVKLGVVVKELTAELARQFGYGSKTRGIVIEKVYPDTIAELNGLKAGDIIVSIGGERITTVQQLKDIIQQTNLKSKGLVLKIRNYHGVFTLKIKPGLR